MTGDSFINLYQWARNHIGQPLMLGYELQKVNGQTPGSLLLLLRQRASVRPEAEIQIEHRPDQVVPYQANFSALPFTTRILHPDLLRIGFASQTQLSDWLKTGHKRIVF